MTHRKLSLALCALSLVYFLIKTPTALSQDSLILTSLNGASAFGLALTLDSDTTPFAVVTALPLQTQQVILPTNLAAGSHILKVRRTFSDSQTLLAGFQITFQPYVTFNSNSRHTLSDLLNQIRPSASYNITVGPKPTINWGVLVLVNNNTTDPIYDRLLAMSGGNLIFLTDVQVNSTSGTVSLVGTQPHPLSDVLTIQSLEAQSDYNLYYADALLSGKKQVATYNLGISSVANGIIYSGSWALTDNNSGTIYPALPIDFLYALYEAPGQNPTQAALTRSMLNDVARLKGIPPHILYGVAFQESSWQQFADGFTKISADGGIGLFQLTAATALNNTSGVAALSRLYGLSSDATINAKAGADALNAKFQAANSVGTDVPTILEDWYNALLAYNGVAPKNYPLQTKDPFGTYQHKVFTQIAKGPLWPPTSTLGEPDKNDVGKYTTLADGTVLLPPEIPYTPFPIHQEAGFNGAIDAVILPTYKKTFSASATNPSQVLLTMTNMTTYAMGNVLVQSATAVFNSGQNVPTSIISGPKAVLTAGSSTSFTLQLSSTGTVIDVRPAMKCSTYSDNLQFR